MEKKTCMQPDPNPKLPGLSLPEMACDAHCHVFGPKAEFPYHENSTYEPPDAGKMTLKALHDFLGFSRAVIVQASCHGPDNRAMLDAIKWRGDQFWRGVCIANKSFTEKDFEALHEGGVRGVRFNFVKHLGGAPDLEGMKMVLEKVKVFNWHLVIHVNAEDIIKYEDFFKPFKDLVIIVDHMGRVPTNLGVDQPAFKILLDFMQRDNWWVKISGAERISTGGPPFYDAVPYAQKLIKTAPDRILWGTDFPHPNIKEHMPNDGHLVDLLGLFCNDESLLKKILVDNPNRLYWND
ncbi:MAG: amidohydrolase family protein [Saprospiraceae bacterium]|nr:amidohydrolase family protein [Saprospiraceae bacterium]